MAKPIFIMQLSISNPEGLNEWVNSIRKKVEEDYHFICLFDMNLKHHDFKVFSDREIEPIELEKLKEIVFKN